MARTAKTKSISFKEEYFAEYEYLDKMKGASEYVCELVRKDRISKEENIELIDAQIDKLLDKMKELNEKKKNGQSSQ